MVGDDSRVTLVKQDGFTRVLTIPAAATPTRVKVLMAKAAEAARLDAFAKTSPAAAGR